ncbi:hypothetical protein O181_028055 [Austropuccinia psidii MF-1]|uniref:DUF7904 domain-containing protein n=1 Tax=Austropuccinia psidii MF-1 TaxID=1389203 RepID=A0A9Q3CS22_9BASI|nr:hypothetical protein [Austropuccinia psidii MF-1]
MEIFQQRQDQGDRNQGRFPFKGNQNLTVKLKRTPLDSQEPIHRSRHLRCKSLAQISFEESCKDWTVRIRATQRDIDRVELEEQQKLRKELLAIRRIRQSLGLNIKKDNLIHLFHRPSIPNSNINSSSHQLEPFNLSSINFLNQSPHSILPSKPSIDAMSDHIYSLPRSSSNHSNSKSTPDLSQTSHPNQNHAIQFSSKFTTIDKKPVSLAHFMGARRDVNGPVLTKQHVDEKELRPDGWELAEKRFEIMSKQSQPGPGINSLANFLSSGSAFASHAVNSTKRPLPGPLYHQPPIIQTIHMKNQKLNEVYLIHRNISLTLSSPSNAAAYLKPKSLADRLAQLGVTNDVQPIKSSLLNSQSNTQSFVAASPQIEKIYIDQTPNSSENHSSSHDKPTKEFQNLNKTKSAFNLRPTSLLDNIDEPKEQRPISLYNPVGRSLPSPVTNTHSSNHHSQISLSRNDTPRQPLTNRSNDPSQPIGNISHKNNQSQLNFPFETAHPSEDPNTLGVPSKVMTASLSRLAGSNIVSQRLQWSKEKEKLGTMDEFGNSLPKYSHNPSTNSPNIPILSVLPKNFTDSEKTSFKELPSPNPQTHLHHQRHHSALTDLNEPSPAPAPKHINQHNKTTRSSDEDDERHPSQVRIHDNKRNKKNFHNIQLDNISPLNVIKKANHTFESHRLNSQTSPSRSSAKNRSRLSRRPSVSQSSFANHPRPELPETPSNTTNQLPSISTFSPVIKKGASEIAAAWESQTFSQPKKSNLSESQTNTSRPLPMPPTCVTLSNRSKLTAVTDSRPLPVPPASTTTSKVELRHNARPLPIPQVKSEPPQSYPFKVHKNNSLPMKRRTALDISRVWALYEDRCQQLAALAKPDSLIKVELFQLSHNHSDEISTTMIDPEDYGTFYSQEMLLIICSLRGSKTVLMIWKGKEVEDDEDEKTEIKIGRLLKKYGIERQSELVMIRQGYEPPELIKALGGRLLLRAGDRFDSVYLGTLSSFYSCKSFDDPSGRPGRNSVKNSLVVIEESNLGSELLKVGLCAGYCGLLKLHEKGQKKLRLFLWKGSQSNQLEAGECKWLIKQIRNESAGYQMDIKEVDENFESNEFLSLCGQTARSYHWRYKAKIPMVPLMTNSGGELLDRISKLEISIIHTGLEIFVIVPPDQRTERDLIEASMKAAESLSLIKTQGVRKLSVNCLIFPSVIPIDLLASIRFSHDLIKLNDGFGKVEKMHLISLAEIKEDW